MRASEVSGLGDDVVGDVFRARGAVSELHGELATAGRHDRPKALSLCPARKVFIYVNFADRGAPDGQPFWLNLQSHFDLEKATRNCLEEIKSKVKPLQAV